MIKIEVDREVFEFLQRNAQPLVDTPNDVLRRCLLRKEIAAGNGEKALAKEARMIRFGTAPPISAEAFVQELLRSLFGSGFRRRSPYRMMFESNDALVYFQNFNKRSDHLWYRVTANPWQELLTSQKKAWVVFTNPAEGFAFAIPVADIIERSRGRGWTRDYLEVNIDPGTCRWSELDWDLTSYRKTVRE